jgi:hypothetical protein
MPECGVLFRDGVRCMLYGAPPSSRTLASIRIASGCSASSTRLIIPPAEVRPIIGAAVSGRSCCGGCSGHGRATEVSLTQMASTVPVDEAL